ncbi:hypothetical protein TWF694_000514 [Orbilia ellipsospora]|uniref:Uncharacterized protein n=1 Tax=Orbilia ellipsospora TaxID=2528407 RepID=A0AAV9XNT9_9PEZI
MYSQEMRPTRNNLLRQQREQQLMQDMLDEQDWFRRHIESGSVEIIDLTSDIEILEDSSSTSSVVGPVSPAPHLALQLRPSYSQTGAPVNPGTTLPLKGWDDENRPSGSSL